MSYIVRIPEPCHEDWNKMSVDEKGRFCNVCSKSVVDFTHKTDTEIHSILIEKSKEKVCGRFKSDQIERPINTDEGIISESNHFRKIFLAAALLIFGTFLFSCKDDNGKLMGEPEIMVMGGIQAPEIKPLSIDTTKLDSITPSQLIYSGEVMIAGGLSYERIPEIVEDTIPDVTISDTIDYVVRDFGVLGGAVYYEEIDEVDNKVVNPVDKEITGAVEIKTLNVFPNPSSGEYTIEYELKKPSNVELVIYDMTGAAIKQVIKPMVQQSGIYRMQFNLNEFPSGIYICKFIKDSKAETKQLVLAK